MPIVNCTSNVTRPRGVFVWPSLIDMLLEEFYTTSHSLCEVYTLHCEGVGKLGVGKLGLGYDIAVSS